jgi:hypothetical protein
VKTLIDIEQRLDAIVVGAVASDAEELLGLGEATLEHWVRAKGLQPGADQREGFRLLGLHRQGAKGDPSFNACRETCRELAYHYNVVSQQPEPTERSSTLHMMALVANHLLLFVSAKMQVQQIGEFCCSSKSIRAEA